MMLLLVGCALVCAADICVLRQHFVESCELNIMTVNLQPAAAAAAAAVASTAPAPGDDAGADASVKLFRVKYVDQ